MATTKWFCFADRSHCCTAKESYADYKRFAPNSREAQSHPFLVSSTRVLERLCKDLCGKKNWPQLKDALYTEAMNRIISRYERNQATHWFDDWKPDRGALSTYLSRNYLDYAWDSLIEGMEGELAELMVGQASLVNPGIRLLTKQDARNEITARREQNAKARGKGMKEPFPVPGPLNVSLDDERLASPGKDRLRPDRHTSIHGIALDELLKPNAQLPDRLWQIPTPMRSALRVRTLAPTMDAMCDAMLGLPVHGQARTKIGEDHVRVFKAWWGILDGRYSQFAQDKISTYQRLAEQLGLKNRDTVRTLIDDQAIPTWLNPPEDGATDTPDTQAKKQRFRVLAYHTWLLCLPSHRWVDGSAEQIQSHIAQLRHSLQMGAYDGKGVTTLRKMVHDYWQDHLSPVEDAGE